MSSTNFLSFDMFNFLLYTKFQEESIIQDQGIQILMNF